MPQQAFFQRHVPMRITHELSIDPLNPDNDPHGLCRVHDAKGKVLASVVVMLPPAFASSVHGKAVEASLAAWEAGVPIDACRTYRRVAMRWRSEVSKGLRLVE